MAMTKPSTSYRAMALVCLLFGMTSLAVADDGNGVTDAPQAAVSDAQIDSSSDTNFYPSEVDAPIQQAYPRTHRHPTDPTINTEIAKVSHGPVIVDTSNSRRCLQCVDRDGEGLIGGIGMKYGIGPCPGRDSQCWQCPYNSPFHSYGPGEYAGPARIPRIPEYRLRSGDQILLLFTLTELKSEGAYRLVAGDELMIEVGAERDIADEGITEERFAQGTLSKGVEIQPDGTITLRLIGPVHAAGQTIEQLRDVLEERYNEFYGEAGIDVTPVATSSTAKRIREALSGTGGFDPQEVIQTITPSGELRLPRIGSVQAQGLTLEELKQEINLRYDQIVGGLEVEPTLDQQAAHNIFVLGEVVNPGRYNLGDTPTTVLGAMAMAGGHIPGANLRQVVIFRRGEQFELLSTTLDLRGAILGREAHPCDEIWIRDNDVIIVPAAPIRLFNNFVQQVFTDGIYGVFPVTYNYVLNNDGGGVVGRR